MNSYLYDPGEHRTKHCGLSVDAQFEMNGSIKIGKCPSSLSKQVAQTLLQTGLPDPDTLENGHPKRIYAVYDGVVYQAVPTIPGISYHGFPWCGKPGHNRLPRAIKRELEQWAAETGCSDKLKEWLKNHEC
jgi:hypothetical protein